MDQRTDTTISSLHKYQLGEKLWLSHVNALSDISSLRILSDILCHNSRRGQILSQESEDIN